MSFRTKLSTLFDRYYYKENTKTTPSQTLLDAWDAYKERALVASYKGIGYGTYNADCIFDNPETPPQSKTDNFNVTNRSNTIHNDTYHYTSIFDVDITAQALASLKMHMESVGNSHDIFGTGSRRVYNSSGTYTTMTAAQFFEAFDDWVMYDFATFNQALSSGNSYSYIGAYDSNDDLIQNTNNLLLGFYNFCIQLTCKNNGSDSTANGFAGRKVVGLSSCIFNPTINQNGNVDVSSTTASGTLIDIYSAVKGGVDTQTANEYQLQGDYIHLVYNNSGNQPVYIFHKDIIDSLMYDLMELTGYTMTYTGNIVNPDPPSHGYLSDITITSDNSEGTTTMTPAFDPDIKNYALYSNYRSIRLYATVQNIPASYDNYGIQVYRGIPGQGGMLLEWVRNANLTNFLYTISNTSEIITFLVIGEENGEWETIDRFNVAVTYDPNFVPEDLQTMAPGQDINPVINTGGTGDFHSGTIEEMQTGATGTSGYNGTSYILNTKAFKAIKHDMWAPDFIDMIKNLNNTGQNAIINCLLLPFNVQSLTGVTSSAVTSVYLGTYEIELSSPEAAYVITGTGATYVEVGPVSFSKVLGGYLDDAPVTECYINLPFIGMKPIDPEILYGHQVKVRYLIDLTTGECTAQVKSNVLDDTTKYISMYEFNGQIGIPLAFTESNINQNRLAIGIETVKGALAGAADGGSIGALAGGASALASGVMNNVNSVHVDGATGSGLERLKSMDIFVLFIYPKTAIPNDYNKIKGRPSSITVAPSSLKGYTVIEEPILNISGTEEEKEELNSLLKSGIRIK